MKNILILILALILSAAYPAPARAGGIIDWMTSFFITPPVPTVKAPPPGPPPDIYLDMPKVGFVQPGVSVGEAAGQVVLEVRRSVSSGENVTIHYSTGEITARDGKDYSSIADGIIKMPPGVMKKKITVPIIDNKVYDHDRTFRVTLSKPANATIDKDHRSVVVRIINDDPAAPAPRPGKLSIQPLAADFGKVKLETRSIKSIIVTNGGGRPVRVAAVLIKGGDYAFAPQTDDCSMRLIQPSSSCEIVVNFIAFDSGSFKGKLVVRPENGMDIAISLTGQGVDVGIKENPEAARIMAKRNQRRAVGGSIFSTVVPPLEPSSPVKYKLSDKDYSSIGVGRNYFTLPVDRTRIITMDRYIPCVLEDTINSQIAGLAHCVIEQNVYGSTGRMVLIPAGTRVVGNYKPLEKTGDTRLNIIWRRFIRPDGSSIMVNSFQTMDVAGRTGAPGKIDNRIWERYGGAILMTSISVAAALAIPTNNDKYATAYNKLSSDLSDITTQLLEHNLDLRSISTVQAGSRLLIAPLVDLWFKRPGVIVAVKK